MAGCNIFPVWRRDEGPVLRRRIAELEEKLQERAVNITRLEELLEKRNSESDKVEAILHGKVSSLERQYIVREKELVYLRQKFISHLGDLRERDREKEELEAALRGNISELERQNSAREQELGALRREISNLKKNLEEKERLLDKMGKNNVGSFSVPLSTAIDIPTVLVELDGVQRPFIIDTGAAVCLIEPGISDAETTATDIGIVGITGDILRLQGEQIIDFTLGGKVLHHRFGVSAVPAAAEGLLGTDFLAAHEARVDFANGKLHLRQSPRLAESAGTSNQGSQSLNPSSSQPEQWLIKTMDTVRLAPRSNNIILGELNLQKHQENPQLVCLEPARLPFEGLLVARGVLRLFRQARRTKLPRELAALAVKDRPPTRETSKPLVHVLVVNFKQEEIELPKATVLGIGEKMSEPLISENSTEQSEGRPRKRKCLDEKLAHLLPDGLAVIGPVPVKYRKISRRNRFGRALNCGVRRKAY
jgi:hypothetical protein